MTCWKDLNIKSLQSPFSAKILITGIDDSAFLLLSVCEYNNSHFKGIKRWKKVGNRICSIITTKDVR